MIQQNISLNLLSLVGLVLQTTRSAFMAVFVFVLATMLSVSVPTSSNGWLSGFSSAAHAQNADGDALTDIFDTDDDNDGIRDGDEGGTATSYVYAPTDGDIQAIRNTNANGSPVLLPLTIGGSSSLPFGGVNLRWTSGGGGSANGWGRFSPPVNPMNVNLLGVDTTVQTPYIDIVGNIPRTFSLDFGASAQGISTATSQYVFVLGVAGLSGEDGGPTEFVTDVQLTTVASGVAFNWVAPPHQYSLLNGVESDQTGLTGNVIATNTANTTGDIRDSPVDQYTFYAIPSTSSLVNVTINQPNPASRDQFGFIFGVIELSAPDTDGDNVADTRDLDSDNDGISDIYEAGSAAVRALDTNGDGTISTSESADTDNDGLSNGVEAIFGEDTGVTPVNNDTDGIADFRDLDSDDDGIPDAVEGRATTGYVAYTTPVGDASDSDNDGVVDIFDTSLGFGGTIATFNAPYDDGDDTDGTPDFLDDDSDGDTILDSAESGTISAPSYADPDGGVTTTYADLQNDQGNLTEVDFRAIEDAGITVTKTATLNDGGDGRVDENDTITYSFVVRNVGSSNLTNITVSDPKATMSGGPIALLTPGQSDTGTFTASYSIQVADIDAGSFANTATVSATTPSGGTISSLSDDPNNADDIDGDLDGYPDDETVVTLTAAPAISLVLTDDTSALSSPVAAGDVVSYTYTATNDGNVTLTGVALDPTITDADGNTLVLTSGPTFVSADAGSADGTLLPGEAGTYTATYELTQSDIDAGGISQTADVDGTAPDGTTVVSDTSDDPADATGADDATATAITAAPAISLVLTDDTSALSSPVAAGDVVSYTYTATNDGNVTLTGVALDPTITDADGNTLVLTSGPTFVSADAGSADGTLLPGEAGTYTATYELTQSDIDAGGISQTADVDGTAPDGITVVSDTSDDPADATGADDATATAITAAPAISLVLTDDTSALSSPVAAGDVVSYTYTATNDGNVTLTGVALDP
ncbi:DUF7507 domain-containing protein, partial [Yoonia maritima]|uniref:DUF7507 domain-containing protein n=1 Tax=Yoonia maritima TaxID=1435347 RepID=UPI003D2BFE39